MDMDTTGKFDLEPCPPKHDMSPTRATEIINFIETGADTKFCNIRDALSLTTLAKTAYRTLDRKPPSCLGDLIQQASARLGKNRERLGLDISPTRASYLVNHLMGKEKEADPKFRQNDDITKQREVLRKAIATVAKIYEARHDDTTHRFVIHANDLVEKQYPLKN